MTDEEINIAIAEHCGWTRIEELDNTYYADNLDYIISKPDKIWGGVNPKTGDDDFIPDYCNDLNAMHEAEKELDWQGKTKFAEILYRHCPDSYIRNNDETEWDEIFPLINSTAQQRAQAFLKAIGKWEQK